MAFFSRLRALPPRGCLSLSVCVYNSIVYCNIRCTLLYWVQCSFGLASWRVQRAREKNVPRFIAQNGLRACTATGGKITIIILRERVKNLYFADNKINSAWIYGSPLRRCFIIFFIFSNATLPLNKAIPQRQTDRNRAMFSFFFLCCWLFLFMIPLSVYRFGCTRYRNLNCNSHRTYDIRLILSCILTRWKKISKSTFQIIFQVTIFKKKHFFQEFSFIEEKDFTNVAHIWFEANKFYAHLLCTSINLTHAISIISHGLSKN